MILTLIFICGFGINLVMSLDCLPPGSQPCLKEPLCCNSGYFTTKPCGNCRACVKAEGEKCGGLFDEDGICAPGLHCKKHCPPEVADGDECKLRPWGMPGKCVKNATTEVARPELCSLPPMRPDFGIMCLATIPVYHWDNKRGKCVKYVYGGCGGTKNLFDTEQDCYDTCNGGKPTAAVVDNGWRKAPKCSSCPDKNACRCALEASPERNENCIAAEWQRPDHKGYCFLENIQDPKNPTKHCFNDMKWSITHSRYYSYEACDTYVPYQNLDKYIGLQNI